MHNPQLTKTFLADADVPPHRIVTGGSADDRVVPASATTQFLRGVSDAGLGLRPAGTSVDIHVSGVVEVEYGATVLLGDPLTADANGCAVPVALGAPNANPPVRFLGFSQEAGPAGVIGSLLIAPGLV